MLGAKLARSSREQHYLGTAYKRNFSETPVVSLSVTPPETASSPSEDMVNWLGG